MIKTLTITLSPAEAADDLSIRKAIATESGVSAKKVAGYIIQKQSIDARSRQARIILQLQAFIEEQVQEAPAFDPQLRDVTNAPHVVIVGAGPAGLFAALRLITLGIKPIIIERGKD